MLSNHTLMSILRLKSALPGTSLDCNFLIWKWCPTKRFQQKRAMVPSLGQKWMMNQCLKLEEEDRVWRAILIHLHWLRDLQVRPIEQKTPRKIRTYTAFSIMMFQNSRSLSQYHRQLLSYLLPANLASPSNWLWYLKTSWKENSEYPLAILLIPQQSNNLGAFQWDTLNGSQEIPAVVPAIKISIQMEL